MTPEMIFSALMIVCVVLGIGARIGYALRARMAKRELFDQAQGLSNAIARTRTVMVNIESVDETLQVLNDELKAMNWRKW